jgi:hypothetical protein
VRIAEIVSRAYLRAGVLNAQIVFPVRTGAGRSNLPRIFAPLTARETGVIRCSHRTIYIVNETRTRLI